MILAETISQSSLIFIATLSIPLLFLFISIFHPKPNIYLLDFVCYKPSVVSNTTVTSTRKAMSQMCRLSGNFSFDNLNFIEKILEKSGLGDSTYLPAVLLTVPQSPSLPAARRESEESMFGAIDALMEKTRIRGDEIGILVVNCSAFSVVPSLAAIIVRRYGLGEDVLSYNLTGLGCSGGLTAIGLAKTLLEVHPNTRALVVSTENITQNCYNGNTRSMILLNCLFRVGAAAVILSNCASDRSSSKYHLLHTIHSNTGSSDQSYNCIYQNEDEEGHMGFAVSKDLLVVGIKAIEDAMRKLAPLILPTLELIRYGTNNILRHVKMESSKYIPNFNGSFDHFLPHVGGRPVLDELERNLGFGGAQAEASRMTLFRFGNTSSSSVWYELAYVEAKGRVKKGDLVWQMAFGSGFECSNAIWRALRSVELEEGNPWRDEIDGFPVDNVTHGSFPYHFETSK